MGNYKYMLALIRKKLFHDRQAVVNYCKMSGMKVGENCAIFSNIVTGEPYLVTLGNNVTISTDVTFCTHDASIGLIFGKKVLSDMCGRINIGNNCFIGLNSTVLYGITLADNIIVAAGSVVTRSFTEERIIIGGNPAKKISTWDSLKAKGEIYGLMLHGKSFEEIRETILNNEDKLIKR